MLLSSPFFLEGCGWYPPIIAKNGDFFTTNLKKGLPRSTQAESIYLHMGVRPVIDVGWPHLSYACTGRRSLALHKLLRRFIDVCNAIDYAPGEILRCVQRGEFAPPRQIDPSIDRALEAVCLKAMALRPEDRYTSPRLLAEDIERWMADEPVSACREPWTRKLMRWLTRHAPEAPRWVLRAWRFWVWGAVVAVEATANAELARSKAAVQTRYDPAVDGGHLQPQRSPTPQRGKE